MQTLSSHTVRRMHELSWQLVDCPADDLETRTLEWLLAELAGDYASFSDFRPGPRPLRMPVTPLDSLSGPLEEAAVRLVATAPATDHPIVSHYFLRRTPPTPVRMSDVATTRQLRRTQAWAEVLRPIGADCQVVILTRRDAPGDGGGFTVTRHGRDFTDTEMELTLGLQPVLVTLRLAQGLRPADEYSWAAAARIGLTTAELEVLRLLATGLTATAIGHVRRTSARTVRKHLERIYDKLGCHDRLLAVARARDLGLTQPAPRS